MSFRCRLFGHRFGKWKKHEHYHAENILVSKFAVLPSHFSHFVHEPAGLSSTLKEFEERTCERCQHFERKNEETLIPQETNDD